MKTYEILYESFVQSSIFNVFSILNGIAKYKFWQYLLQCFLYFIDIYFIIHKS